MRFKIALFALVLAALVGIPLYFIPRKILINSFSCENQFAQCRDELREKIEENRGMSLRDTKKKIQELLATDPLVSDFSTQYKIPDKLEIEAILRKPFFSIAFDSSENRALIDEEGYVLAFKKETSLPVLFAANAPPQVGEKVGDKTFFALKLLQDMYDYYQIKTAREEEGGVAFDMEGKKKVLFPLEGDRQILVASLAVILTRLNADDSSTRIENVEGLKSTCLKGCTIDLRYKNPVIR